MVVVGRYLLTRRGWRGWGGVRKIAARKGWEEDGSNDPRSPPFLPFSSTGQGVGHSLSGIWANETRTVHVHQYIDPAHRPSPCVRPYTQVQREVECYIARWEKTEGGDLRLVAKMFGSHFPAARAFCSFDSMATGTHTRSDELGLTN